MLSPEDFEVCQPSNNEQNNSFWEEEDRLRLSDYCIVYCNLSQANHSERQSFSPNAENGSTQQDLTDFEFLDNLKLAMTKSSEDSSNRVLLGRRRLNSLTNDEKQLAEIANLDMRLQMLDAKVEEALGMVRYLSEVSTRRFADNNMVFEISYQIKVSRHNYQVGREVVEALLGWCEQQATSGELRFKKKHELIQNKIWSIFDVTFSRNQL